VSVFLVVASLQKAVIKKMLNIEIKRIVFFIVLAS